MANLEYCSNCGKLNKFGRIDNIKRYHCPSCGKIHYENPKPTATLVCPKGNQILLVKRAFQPGKGFWGLPGGFVELNETPEIAAVRELKEETNLDGNVISFLGHCSHPKSIFGDILLLGMLMDINNWPEMVPGDDAEETRLFDMLNLPRLAFKCHQKILDMYLNL